MILALCVLAALTMAGCQGAAPSGVADIAGKWNLSLPETLAANQEMRQAMPSDTQALEHLSLRMRHNVTLDFDAAASQVNIVNFSEQELADYRVTSHSPLTLETSGKIFVLCNNLLSMRHPTLGVLVFQRLP